MCPPPPPPPPPPLFLSPPPRRGNHRLLCPYVRLPRGHPVRRRRAPRTAAGAGPERSTLKWLRPEDVVYRLEGDALVGVLASTEHLTVATLSLPIGKVGAAHAHGGDEVAYVTAGILSVRVWDAEQTYVFELSRGDASYIPAGAVHEYRNYGAAAVEAVVGVAPEYLVGSLDTLS